MQDHNPKELETKMNGLKVRVIYIEEFEGPNEATAVEILQYFQEINFKKEVTFQIDVVW